MRKKLYKKPNQANFLNTKTCEYPNDTSLKEQCPERKEDTNGVAAEETVSKRGRGHLWGMLA